MRAHHQLAAGVAVIASIMIAGEAFAAAWAWPVPLTASEGYEGTGLASLGSATAVAIYEGGGVYARRTTDGGLTWGAAIPLSASGGGSAIGGYGTGADVVWRQGDDVRYARSTNRGQSFAPPITLSSSGRDSYFPTVARGPSGRVVVAWLDWTGGSSTSSIKARVSTNGGTSFGAIKTLVDGSGGSPSVAVGDGVIYVAYRDGSGLEVLRSTDSGATWQGPKLVGADAYGDPLHKTSMTAAGSRAYIAYVVAPGGGPNGLSVRYSGTTDKGKTWSSPRNLSPALGSPGYLQSDTPSISLGGGVVRVVFSRWLEGTGQTQAVFYRQSSNGVTWTAAYRVSIPTETPLAHPGGLGKAGRTIVLYSGGIPGERYVFVRTKP